MLHNSCSVFFWFCVASSKDKLQPESSCYLGRKQGYTTFAGGERNFSTFLVCREKGLDETGAVSLNSCHFVDGPYVLLGQKRGITSSIYNTWYLACIGNKQNNRI